LKAPFNLNRTQLVHLAVGGLWLRLASLLALVVFTIVRGGAGFWLPLIDFLASGVLLVLWTPLISQYLLGQPVRLTDSRRPALTLMYPWLIAYEGALWLLFTFLPALSGYFPEVNPVASAVQVTVSGASIAVSFLIYLLSLRQMPNPADATGRAQLGDLFNLAAALAAALMVLNVVPMSGTPAPTLGDKLAYGLANAAEAASWLLLRWALLAGSQEAGAPEAQKPSSDT
jgi:hypothetical protein